MEKVYNMSSTKCHEGTLTFNLHKIYIKYILKPNIYIYIGSLPFGGVD